MTDDRVATRITVRDPDGSDASWRCRSGSCGSAANPRWSACASRAPTPRRPAPGVLDALDAAETILVCPSNPVISIGPILAVAGVRDAARAPGATGWSA